MACLTEQTDPSPLPLARAQGHGSPDSLAYPTGSRIRRPARVSHWFGANYCEERRRSMAHIPYVNRAWERSTANRCSDRLSTNGWDGQSLVVTLARTSSPTRPVAGPTKSPSCVIPPAYVAGYSTPPRVAQNLAIPPSPISPE
jgi:hypothetical protein